MSEQTDLDGYDVRRIQQEDGSIMFENRPSHELKTTCPSCGGALILMCAPSLLLRKQGEMITALQFERDSLLAVVEQELDLLDNSQGT